MSRLVIAGASRAVTLMHRPDGLGELATTGVLEQEPARPRLHRPVDVLVEVEGREHEDSGPAAPAYELRGRLDPVNYRHPHIHEHDVRIDTSRRGKRLAAVADLPRHAEIRLGLEQHPKALSDQVLIVGDQDADHVYPPSPARRPPSGSIARTA